MITQAFTRLAFITALILLSFNIAFAEENPAQADNTSETSEMKSTADTDSTTAADTTATDATSADTPETDSASEAASKPQQEANRRIARAQFTTAISDREPTDNIVMLTNNNEKIYFFTELINFDGQNVKHRWEYEGKEMATVNFKVDGARWRVHSSKNIKPEWKGVWSVIVYDEEDRPLKVTSFEVVDANTNN